jgi:hypothetical protein
VEVIKFLKAKVAFFKQYVSVYVTDYVNKYKYLAKISLDCTSELNRYKTVRYNSDNEQLITNNYLGTFMDTFNQLAELALGSRLKRLSEVFLKNVSDLYRQFDLEFEAK